MRNFRENFIVDTSYLIDIHQIRLFRNELVRCESILVNLRIILFLPKIKPDGVFIANYFLGYFDKLIRMPCVI